MADSGFGVVTQLETKRFARSAKNMLYTFPESFPVFLAWSRLWKYTRYTKKAVREPITMPPTTSSGR